MIKYTETKNAPKAIGPYSQATIYNGLVYCSGQISIDPKTQEFISGDVETQTIRVLENLKAVLEDSGSSLENTLKVTVFISDMNDFTKINEIYGKYFTQKPARATVEVSTLPKYALVEIDCIAHI